MSIIHDFYAAAFSAIISGYIHTMRATQTTTVPALELKAPAKAQLQQSLGWPREPRRPLLCLPLGMSDQLGGPLFEATLPGLLTLPIELVVLGRGSSHYGALFSELARKESHRVSILPDTPEEQKRLLLAADIALYFSDRIGENDIRLCLQHGTVPVAPALSKLDDYNLAQETGNAFVFSHQNAWQAFAAVVRALETHKFPYDWKTIQKHCQESAQ